MNELKYRLAFCSPVCVFSGLASAGIVDRTVVRNREKLPYIPGSSVKGRWRYVAERLLRTITSEGVLEGLSAHPIDGPLCKSIEDACTICRIFGSSSFPATLWVGQAELTKQCGDLSLQLMKRDHNPVVHPDAELRIGISLSRFRRAALENQLFIDEVVPPTVFTGSILVHRELSSQEKQFIHASARLVDRIGGRKTVGHGILSSGIEILGGLS